MGILSVKFSLAESSTHCATDVHVNLATHHDVGWFKMYFASASNKQTVLRQVGRPLWPSDDNHCWRCSYRSHQVDCMRSCGFMIQIEECQVEGQSRPVIFKLGDGQKIESLMAVDLGWKILVILTTRMQTA